MRVRSMNPYKKDVQFEVVTHGRDHYNEHYVVKTHTEAFGDTFIRLPKSDYEIVPEAENNNLIAPEKF